MASSLHHHCFVTQMGQIHPTYFVSCLHTSCKNCDVLIPDLSGKGDCGGTCTLEVKCNGENKVTNHDGNEVLPPQELMVLIGLHAFRLRVLFLKATALTDERSSVSLLRIPT